jgi:hypothetical protein
VCPCSLMFWLVLRSHGTWFFGSIQCCVQPQRTCPVDGKRTSR